MTIFESRCASCGRGNIPDTRMDCSLEMLTVLIEMFPGLTYAASAMVTARHPRLRDR